jgi:hypothetical protein
MATRALVATSLGTRCIDLTWTGLLNTDDGAPFDQPDHDSVIVQVAGTFGTGGTLIIEGSNDGTSWATLNNQVGGTALSFTGAGLRQIAEQPRYIRPRVTAGDGATNLAVRMLVRGWRR